MRYSRLNDYVGVKKRTTTTSPPAGSSSGGRTGKALLAIIVICVAAYFLSAGVIGNWVASNVVMPVMSMFNTEKAAEPESPLATQSPAEELQENSAVSTKSVSQQISIKGFNAYALQLGAFSSAENASVEANSMKARGAAGYILNDTGHHRVFASIYNTNEEAKQVKENLMSTENIDSSIFAIETGDLNMTVTASEDKIALIKQCFDDYLSVKDKLGALILACDKKEKDYETCKAEVLEMKDTLQKALDSLSTIPGQNGSSEMLTSLGKVFETSIAKLNDIATGGYADGPEFSSALKYAEIELIYAYSSFIQSVTK